MGLNLSSGFMYDLFVKKFQISFSEHICTAGQFKQYLWLLYLQQNLNVESTWVPGYTLDKSQLEIKQVFGGKKFPITSGTRMPPIP